jgi:hypothetical protein
MQIIIKIQAATTGHYPGKKRALLIVLGQEKKLSEIGFLLGFS